MKIPRLKPIAIALLTTLLMSGCSSFLSLTHDEPELPSDKELEEKFRANETAFARLVQMFKEDTKLNWVSLEEMNADESTKLNIPQSRIDEYRKILKQIGVKSIGRNEKGNIVIGGWYKHTRLSGGILKQYVYTEMPPSHLLKSLDGATWEGYKRIADNWYLHVVGD